MELIIVYLHMFISGTSFISLWNFLMSEKVRVGVYAPFLGYATVWGVINIVVL
jgi:hypothetical protein